MAVAFRASGNLPNRVGDIMKKSEQNRVKSAPRSRRAFLGSLIAGIGASRVLPTLYASGGSPEPQAPAPPTNVRLVSGSAPVSGAVLTQSDLMYLGSFKVPSGEGLSQALYYSVGAFSIRRGLDGRGPLTFLMSGPNQGVSGWEQFAMLREFTYPGESLSAPPVATTVQDWADIWNGKGTGIADTLNRPQDGYPILWGLYYDQSTNLLWWTYQTPYNSVWNPSIGCTLLNPDGTAKGFGPWRTSTHSGKTGGFITPIPSGFQQYVGGKTHVLGAAPHVQNSVTAFGGELQAVSLPPKETTPDVVSNSNASIVTQALLDYDINNPQPRNVSGLILCTWNCGLRNPPAGCSGNYDSTKGGAMSPAAPYFSGANPGSSLLLDWMDTCSWIDTGSKRGIVQFGQLIDTIPGHVYEDGGGVCHSWYGPGTCVHGQVDATHPATGPGAGTLASTVWIWDPNDLVAVAKGSASPHSPLPRSTCLVTQLANAGSIGAGINGTGGKYRWGQSHYDPVTGKLFVSEKMVDAYGCCTFVPRIHVFQVAQS
jgi:hypothetical protein